MYYDAPAVFPEYLLIFPWFQRAWPGRTCMAFAPCVTAEHAFQECSGIEFDIPGPEEYSVIRTHFDGFPDTFLRSFCRLRTVFFQLYCISFQFELIQMSRHQPQPRTI